ncbi:MAG: hypothetical protein ACFFB5_24305 [Promethearchaeota archaeon]
MNRGEEFQVGDPRSLTLLKLIWGIWTVLTGIMALFMIMFIFIGITYLPRFLHSPTNGGESYFVFGGLVDVGLWVLFGGNIYITFGLNRLHYFRWKLLIIESGLIGIVMGFVSLNVILDIRNNLQNHPMSILVALVGIGFPLVLLYLAFNVRDKFSKT